MGWELSARYAPPGKCPFSFSWDSFCSFFFLLEPLSLPEAASSSPLPSGSSLEENFLFFLATLLFLDS